MKKYWAIFKISWEKQFEYRLNFFFWRLRSVIVLILLYYVWTSLSGLRGSFAGYTSLELITYVFIVNILRSVIFGSQSRQVGEEINDGTFSIYLIKPLNHFFYVFFRELGERASYFISAIGEIIILILILKADLFYQNNLYLLFLFFISMIFSFILYFILTYLAGILTFWIQHVSGPRFLFEWILEFASGAYFPLNILPKIIFMSLAFLPFYYIIYFPLSVYLGRLANSEIYSGLGMGLFWIIIAAVLARVAWIRGLKKYSGEGI